MNTKQNLLSEEKKGISFMTSSLDWAANATGPICETRSRLWIYLCIHSSGFDPHPSLLHFNLLSTSNINGTSHTGFGTQKIWGDTWAGHTTVNISHTLLQRCGTNCKESYSLVDCSSSAWWAWQSCRPSDRSRSALNNESSQTSNIKYSWL